MPQLVRVFIAGLSISFLGALPLGTLNVAALQISITGGVLKALYFAAGALLVEMIYVRVSLGAMSVMHRYEKAIKFMEIFSLFLILGLAAFSFYAALNPNEPHQVDIGSRFPTFIMGIILSAVNPVQIPFWFGWSSYLYSKHILKHEAVHYNIYISGIGLGTFSGSCVFIFGGRLIADNIHQNQSLIHWIIGVVFLITALVHTIKLLRKKRLSEAP